MNAKHSLCFFTFVLLAISVSVDAKAIAYIHGDVSADGDIPSGSNAPFHQMLLNDTGRRGCSSFKAMVESKGHTITQHYDQDIELTPEFLSQFDVIIFGLHQKQWSAAEKTALDNWIRAGGSIYIYSDSAAGGLWSSIGAQNPVGQSVVNNIIAQYGMQVTVDQSNGVKAYRADPGASHPIVAGRPVWEGEGVSPVAVDESSGAQALIPYLNDADYKVSGNPDIPHQQNITITNPLWAALALQSVGNGYVIVGFDRQPMWNDGEGSDIEKRDNKEILGRIIDFMTNTSPSENQPPVVAFTEPQSVETFFVPGSLSVTVQASDADGSVSFVDLYIDDVLVRRENSAPYNWNNSNNDPALQNLEEGTYTLRADAMDDKGAVGSDTFTITIQSPSTIISRGNRFITPSEDDIMIVNGKKIVLSLSMISHVSLTITDMAGRSVATLVYGHLDAASYSYLINGNLGAGVYLIRLVRDNQLTAEKIFIRRSERD